LEERELVCDPQLDDPLIQVQVNDAADQPVPGVQIIVAWPGQEERLFTGFKPEIGPGYADFVMEPGVSYILRVSEEGQPVVDLTSEECETPLGERYWGSWLLTFTQPAQ
jgi:hypothetical protein